MEYYKFQAKCIEILQWADPTGTGTQITQSNDTKNQCQEKRLQPILSTVKDTTWSALNLSEYFCYSWRWTHSYLDRILWTLFYFLPNLELMYTFYMCFSHEYLKKIQKFFYQIRETSVFGENINVSFSATVESVFATSYSHEIQHPEPSKRQRIDSPVHQDIPCHVVCNQYIASWYVCWPIWWLIFTGHHLCC